MKSLGNGAFYTYIRLWQNVRSGKPHAAKVHLAQQKLGNINIAVKVNVNFTLELATKAQRGC